MQVLVKNKVINIKDQDVIGPGGEGLVIKTKINGNQTIALKIYHQPTKQRAQKLQAFFARNWNLPTNKVALPIDPVYNPDKSLIIGLTMPYLGTGFDDLAQLSNKNVRTSLGITTKDVALIFLDGYNTLELIHSNGLVVGDLSDRNEMFRGNEMLWIDVDSWQFDKYPCSVATEEYVDPNLYGIDFSTSPSFKVTNDWYSFATLLFRSLLLVHPYGGTHSKIKELKKRAQAKITALDSDVKYPKIAISPDILSDELADEFEKIFKKGVREVFPKSLLQDYLNELTECSNCHTWYPQQRNGCPVCNKQTIVMITRKTLENKDIYTTEFFRTKGNIVYSKVSDNKLFVITHENGKAKLHTIDQNSNVTTRYLFDVTDTVRYSIADNFLAVNPNHTEDLLLLDIGQKNIKTIQQTVTETFSPTRKALFRATQNKILRIVGGNILAMEKGGMGTIERSIRTGIPNQTWFTANDNYKGVQLFGYIQVLHEQKYWMHLDKQNFDVEVQPLDTGEFLMDLSVKFSKENTLLRRKTQQNGIEYLRTDVINNFGKVTHSSKSKYENCPTKSLHGQVYFGNVLLHTTDDGIVQEKITTHECKTFTQTSPFVEEENILFKFNKGLVVISQKNITYIELV